MTRWYARGWLWMAGWMIAQVLTLAAGGAEVRWEAEGATDTNMRADGAYAPAAGAGESALSGGKWLNGKRGQGQALYADYRITVPADGTYRFYVRRFWQHGPFRYRFDEQPWVTVDAARDLLDSQEVMKGVPACWLRVGEVSLSAGEHAFRLEVLQLPGYRYNDTFGFDCFLLTDSTDLPKGAAGMQPDQHEIYRALAMFGRTAPAGFYASGKGRILHVDGATGNDEDAAGTEEKPLRTISAAAARVQPGDTVLVRPGIYRERIGLAVGGTPERPVRFVAASGGMVFIRGSEEWRADWRAEADGVWRAALPAELLRGVANPYLRRISVAPKENTTPARPVDPEQTRLWPLTLGQLFVGGEPYRQLEDAAGVARCPGTWIVSADGASIAANFRAGHRPQDRPLVELTVRERIFAPARRGLGFVQLDGFVFEHCANQGPFPQGGAVSTRSGHHWRIENCTIRYAATAGLDCGAESWNPQTLSDTLPEDRIRFATGYHLIANNRISDNGLVGIEGLTHRNVVVRANVIERNNSRDFQGDRCEWEEWAGIKFHDCDGARIEDNLIRDNEGYGIWLDNRFYDTRITRNLILNNRMAGIFYELGHGPALADNNIIAYTRARGAYYNGMGIYAHDAAGLTLAHNLLLENAGSGVTVRTTSKREFAGYPVHSSGQRILNNIFSGNAGPAINLPLENDLARDNRSDWNLLFGTHEYWQGLENWPGLFAVNLFVSSLSAEQYQQRVAQALSKNGLPLTQLPELQLWRRNPLLSLQQWRAVTGNDVHSVEAGKGLECHLKPGPLLLACKAGETLLKLRCPPVPGCERDYAGDAATGAAVLPGPLQNLQPGENEIPLWPVAPAPQDAQAK